jgi:hypothetical protein
MLAIASSREPPCDWQPFSSGRQAWKPSSSFSITTVALRAMPYRGGLRRRSCGCWATRPRRRVRIGSPVSGHRFINHPVETEFDSRRRPTTRRPGFAVPVPRSAAEDERALSACLDALPAGRPFRRVRQAGRLECSQSPGPRSPECSPPPGSCLRVFRRLCRTDVVANGIGSEPCTLQYLGSFGREVFVYLESHADSSAGRSIEPSRANSAA